MKYRLLCLIALFLMPTGAWASQTIKVAIGQFSEGHMDGWKNKKFKGETKYTLVTDPVTQKQVLQAISKDGASCLFFKQKINLAQTPWLHWSWKPETVFTNMYETEKKGDDYVARIYVVVDGGVFFWQTLALNYVWASSHPYTSNAQMLAVESGAEHANQWQYYKRNVRDDLQAILGKESQYIDGIAIMTDTDNSGLQATTLFGDIYFTAE